jgi:hypothetical protein
MPEIDINYDIIQEMESKQYWRNDFHSNPEIFGMNGYFIFFFFYD